MRTRMVLSSGWVYLALGAAGVPVALIIIYLAAGNPSVAGELAILLAVFAGVMALGAYTFATGAVARMPMATEAAEAAEAGIEWVDGVQLAPLAPVSMRVVKVTGACAFGFMPGNEWLIDANGHLSRPLCSAAVKALSSLRGGPWDAGLPQEFACDCPLAGREVVFAMEHRGMGLPIFGV